MRHRRLLAIAFHLAMAWCLIILSSPVLSQSRVVKTSDLSMEAIHGPESRALDYRFPLRVVVVEDSGWAVAEVHERIKDAAQVLTQCNLGISQARISLVRAPAYLRKPSSPFAQEAVALARSLDESARPIVYFVDSPRDGGSTAFAARLSVMRSLALDPALRDSVWITHALKLTEQTRSFASYYFPSHDVLAHELAHVLGDLEHIHPTRANLMHHSAVYLDNSLTDAQCRAMRTYNSYVRAVPRPAYRIETGAPPAGLLPTNH